MTSILVRDRKQPQRHRAESHVKVEAEVGMILPQVKECQELEGARKPPPLEPSGGV